MTAEQSVTAERRLTADLGRGTRGLVRALRPGLTPAATASGRRAQLAELEVDKRTAWLLFAVLTRTLPVPHDVESAVRFARHEGTAALLHKLRRAGRRGVSSGPAPRIIADAVTIDAHDAVTTQLATGIQRVARAVMKHWTPRDGVQVVGWSPARRQLRLVDYDSTGARAPKLTRDAIVPWGGSYLLTEFVSEPARVTRIQALADFAGLRSGVIGYDVIPLTTAETTGPLMPGLFAKHLAATSRMDVVAAISPASESGYRGWRRMLSAAGLTGPELVTVDLPVEALAAPDESRAAAEALFTPDELPLVLCVGSHEPRKNHTAVLQAAELLWRRGDRFRLVFIGGNAWNTGTFWADLDRLKAAGRPVSAPSGVSDGMLAWGYRLARFTVFPSLDEGFGLPVTESIAVGTPVVTSGYGSMAEIARGHGGLLVDPRNDLELADAMHRLLSDDALRAELSAQARLDHPRGWAEYADELWREVVN